MQNASEVQHSIQRDLDAIFDYGTQWAITFNPSKIFQQSFTRKTESTPLTLTFGGRPIHITDNHKHLGLTLSKDIRFHAHTNTILKKNEYGSKSHLSPGKIIEKIYT